MIPSTLPQLPCEKIGTDLFEVKEKSYLLLVDYFSRYTQVVKLLSTTTKSIVAAMKPLFARHGIPDIVIWTIAHPRSFEILLNTMILSMSPAVFTIHKGMERLSEQSKQSRNYLEILMILP